MQFTSVLQIMLYIIGFSSYCNRIDFIGHDSTAVEKQIMIKRLIFMHLLSMFWKGKMHLL